MKEVLLSLEERGKVDEDVCMRFTVAAKVCLKQQQSDILIDAVTNHEVLLLHTGWELLPIICPYLVNTEERDDVSYENCVTLLELIAKVGKPKEIVLGLLEQIDRFLDYSVFLDFINPIQTALCRMETGFAKSLDIVLSTIYAHVKTIQLPGYETLAEEELLLMTQDPNYRRFEEIVVILMDFVSPFVFKVVQAKKDNNLNKNMLTIRRDIELYLLKLLDYPLVFLSLVDKDDNKDKLPTTFSTCAQQIMKYFEEMNTSFTNLIFYASNNNVKSKPSKQEGPVEEDASSAGDDVDSCLPEHGLACFAYLALSVQLCADQFPSIYSGQHVFQAASSYIINLLQRPQAYAVSKGLDLLNSTVHDVDDLSLPSKWLDSKDYMQIANLLITIMIRCPVDQLRKGAVSLLKPFIKKWEFKGRYQLLRKQLRESNHFGVAGYLIGILKDFVHETLQDTSSNSWFIGQHLVDLCQYVFDLPDGAESDILEQSDKIIAALNFLRYLTLRDKLEVNATGVWTHLNDLDEHYLQPLHKGLDLSIAHYELKLEEIQTKGAKKDDRLNVSVGGQDLPAMPVAQQKEVLKSAQFTFDLIASLLGRVGEVISTEKRMQKDPKLCS
ncbi:glomulin-like [Antedon mediterranea]|uniref:glomulin-like n=1 Tax=Antedon mediterranea TaxID=105859 RepID=UPI003AF57909